MKREWSEAKSEVFRQPKSITDLGMACPIGWRQ
jgi:hypothetical protein